MIDKLKTAFSKENLLDAMVLIVGIAVVKAIRGFIAGFVPEANVPLVLWSIVATVLVAFIPYRRRMWVIAGVAVVVDDVLFLGTGKTLGSMVDELLAGIRGITPPQ